MTQRTSPSRPIDYASKTPSNPAATASLVLGLLFFLFPYVPGLFAVHYGREGLRVASGIGVGGRQSRWGISLGWVNLFLSVAISVAVLILVVRAHRAAERAACLANIRQIQATLSMYANDWNRTPASLDDLTVPFKRRYVNGGVVLMPGYLSRPQAFVCPACSDDPSKPPVAMQTFGPTHHHVLLPNPSVQWEKIKEPDKKVLLYEPLTNHDVGANFLFFDGHVEWLEGSAARDRIAALEASSPAAKPDAAGSSSRKIRAADDKVDSR